MSIKCIKPRHASFNPVPVNQNKHLISPCLPNIALLKRVYVVGFQRLETLFIFTNGG